MLKALIFDFDGLILDTEVPIYESWLENYEAFGRDLPLETYVKCVGSDFNSFDPKAHLESLVNKSIDWEHWDVRRNRDAIERTNQLDPMPGVIDLLEATQRESIPCAVASSSPRSWVEGHLERLGLTSYFALTRCIDDVNDPKPSPELFLAAAEALEVEPSEAIVFEDSLNGLKAAREAGNPCVIVPNRITQHLTFEGATAILESLEDIELETLFSLAREKQGIG